MPSTYIHTGYKCCATLKTSVAECTLIAFTQTSFDLIKAVWTCTKALSCIST